MRCYRTIVSSHILLSTHHLRCAYIYSYRNYNKQKGHNKYCEGKSQPEEYDSLAMDDKKQVAYKYQHNQMYLQMNPAEINPPFITVKNNRKQCI